MQTTAEKVEALRTVLPLLHVHYPASKSCVRYERKPDGTPPPPPDTCNQWDCPTCQASHEQTGKTLVCPDIKWEATRRYYERRYRTGDIERGLDLLYEYAPAAAQSAYYEYVEPWEEFNPGSRHLWAEAALHFLATYLPGDVPYHSPDPSDEPWRFEARHLHSQGFSIRKIAKRLGRAVQTVHATVQNYGITHGRRRPA